MGSITKNYTTLNLIKLSKRGISYKQLERLNERTKLSQKDWLSILVISQGTLRRYKKESRKFNILQSERMLLIDDLYDLGFSIFGSENEFREWMQRENNALGGVVAKSLLNTFSGIDLIKTELHNIEHGIFC